MRRRTPLHAAVASAFARSHGHLPDAPGSQTRLHRAALTFVVAFPGLIGSVALVAALSRSAVNDGAFSLAIPLLAVAGVLLILGLRSVVSVDGDGLTVRFFGIRATTVRFQELASATFGMAFPSISYGIRLTDVTGRNVFLHANWWRDERFVVLPVCRALVEYNVPMDRSTARVVSKLLHVQRPKARIVHHGLLRKDRTW